MALTSVAWAAVISAVLISEEWAVLALPGTQATSAQVLEVGMEDALLVGMLGQAFGTAVHDTMPGTEATKLGMAIRRATITTTSSMTTASTITSTTASWQLESEDGGQATTATDTAIAVAAGCITRRWLPAVHIGGIGTTLAWATTDPHGLGSLTTFCGRRLHRPQGCTRENQKGRRRPTHHAWPGTSGGHRGPQERIRTREIEKGLLIGG